MHVTYIRDNRLGNIDHQRVSEAVANLANVYEEGMGAMKYLAFLPIVCIPLGFCLFAYGAYTSLGAGFNPLVVVGFFTFAGGGMGGMLARSWVDGLGRRAVELEIGKMNGMFPSLNFSIRSETHVARYGHGSDRRTRVYRNNFLVITSLMGSGEGQMYPVQAMPVVVSEVGGLSEP
jgi:hypothetical protein